MTINLGEALQVLTNSFVNTFDVCVNHYLNVSKIESFALLLWSTVLAF